MQWRDRASGVPLEILEHLPPKPESACFTVLCFPPTLPTLTGGCPPTTLFRKKLIQSFQIISLLGIIRVFQSKNPSDGFLACLPDSHSCACDYLRPPDCGRHRKLKTSQECRGFQGVKIIRIGLIQGFIVEPILAAKFSYLLFLYSWYIEKNRQQPWHQQHQIFELSTLL